MGTALTAKEHRIRTIVLAKVRKRFAPMHPSGYLISENITDDVMEITKELVHSAPEDLSKGAW